MAVERIVLVRFFFHFVVFLFLRCFVVRALFEWLCGAIRSVMAISGLS